MAKREERKFISFNTALFLAAFVMTVALVLSGAYIQQGFKIEPRTVAAQRFKAPSRFLNVYATNLNKSAAEEAAAKLEPVMERDTSVVEKTLYDIDHFFELVTLIRREEALKLLDMQTEANAVARAARENQAAQMGEISDFAENQNGESADTGQTSAAEPQTPAEPETPVEPETPAEEEPELPAMPIHLNDRLISLILSMDDERYSAFIQTTRDVVGAIFEDGLQDVEARGLMAVKTEADKTPGADNEKELLYEIIADYIQPNIVVNEEATQNARDERANNFDEVFYLEGQTIVDEGHIISEEAFAALEYLGLVNKASSGFNYSLFGGAFLLVVGVFIMFMMCSSFFFKDMFKAHKEALLFFVLYAFTLAFSWLSIGFPYQISFNLIFLMLVAMLFDPKLAVVMNIFLSVITMLIVKGNVSFLIYYIFTGTYVSFASRSLNERNKIIVEGILTCGVCVAAYFGVTLFFETIYGADLIYGLVYAATMGIASVIVSVGIVPFWEGVFGVVTPFRLIDLANPNSAVLRRLTIEAPGTYHHSIVVANLAETAAYNIGANPNLARAGGYYHDIGKLKYPNYFSENQAGVNPHDMLEPETSAQVIKNHVSFGLELAAKHHIPPIVQEFISQHHGTTLIKYFYGKAIKQAEEDAERRGVQVEAVDESVYRYPFSVPSSRETAIVMLADTVEAAVRSALPAQKSLDEVERFIRKLVKDKLEDNQLIDSGLTVRDIETVTKSFLIVLKGMYHDRIPYPENIKSERTERTDKIDKRKEAGA